MSAEFPMIVGTEPSTDIEKNLLLVGSERDQRIYWKSVFLKMGFCVSEADSVSRALEQIQSGKFRIVVSGLLLSDGVGTELCCRLRLLPQGQHVHFILLTSRDGSSDLVQGLDAGANDFISKTADKSEIRARLGAAVRVVRLTTELAKQRAALSQALSQLRANLEAAERVQRSLLPRERHEASWELATLFIPSDYVSGDMLGAKLLRDSWWLLFGVDVAGHGPSAALMASSVARETYDVAIGQSLTTERIGLLPGLVASELNRRYCQSYQGSIYFTALVAVFDADRGRLHYCQAGHPSPIVLSAGRARTIAGDGFPIGLFDGAEYECRTVQLAAHEAFFSASDGLLESSDADPDGAAELTAALERVSVLERSSLKECLEDYCMRTSLVARDDQSAFMVRYHG